MKVFLTGATGFIGAHITRCLLDSGHHPVLLARNPEALASYFADRDPAGYEVVAGDMLDAGLVRSAMAGCDAVLHAAALVSLESKDAQRVYETNVASIKAVIGAACELGVPNIVYVSSLSVLFQRGITEIDEQTPLGNPKDAYARSKRDCDALVREYQAAGHPVQITYPSGVIGPDDPKFSESNAAFRNFLSVIPNTATGIQQVDVRDVAAMHVYLLEHPPVEGGDRYIMAGQYLTWDEFHRLVSEVTGREIKHPGIPGPAFRMIGRVLDLVKKVYPLNTQIGSESMEIVTGWTPANSDRIRAASGMEFRPLADTFRDTAAWLKATQRVRSLPAMDG